MTQESAYSDPSAEAVVEVEPGQEMLEPAHLQAVTFFQQIFGEDVRIQTCTQAYAQGLMNMVNTMDMNSVPPSDFGRQMGYEEARWTAVMYINGFTKKGIAELQGIDGDGDAIENAVLGLVLRVRTNTTVPALRLALDAFFANPAPWIRGLRHSVDPQQPMTWQDSMALRFLGSERSQTPVEVVDRVEIGRIPEVWSTPRPEQSVPQYVKVVRDDTLQHPDFPLGLVLNEAEMTILNTFMTLAPGQPLSALQIAELDKYHKGTQTEVLLRGLLFLLDSAIIVKDEVSEAAKGPEGWMLNPTIVFMEKRQELAPSVEYACEFDRIIAEIREDLDYQGYAFLSDDTVLGLGHELTRVLDEIFTSGIVRRVEGDRPVTRKRADDRVLARQFTTGQSMPPEANDMPHWTIISRGEDGIIFFKEDISNVARNQSDNISERPDQYPRFYVADHPELQKLATILYLLGASHGSDVVVEIAFHAFETDGAVVEQAHNDGVRLVGIRPSKRAGRGAYTQLIRRQQELDPSSPFGSRPFFSVKIPVGGLLVFNDRRFRHTVTFLHPPRVSKSIAAVAPETTLG